MKNIIVSLICVLGMMYGADNRLVVLDPASIEIIYELGGGEQIVGIATLQQSQIEPMEKTSKLASVGTFSHPSIEKIVKLKPTLVILSLYSIGLKDRLAQLGIETLYVEATELKGLNDNIVALAKILDKKEEGEKLIKRIESELKKLGEQPLNKSAIFVFSSNPIMGFADNSMVADIFRVIGVKNLTAPSKIQRPILSIESILKADPDMIILGIQATDPEEFIRLNPALKKLSAYKNHQIFVYPNTHTLLRISPTIIERIKAFKQALEANLKQ